jgi:hypothetical protein
MEDARLDHWCQFFGHAVIPEFSVFTEITELFDLRQAICRFVRRAVGFYLSM